MNVHKEFWNSFTTENVVVEMGNYLCKKDHNTSSCDVVFAGICNAMNTSTIVHEAQAERNFHEDSPSTRTPKYCC